MKRTILSGALLAAVAAASPATAADVGDFYRGKVLRVVVGYAAGGGFDVYARLLAALGRAGLRI